MNTTERKCPYEQHVIDYMGLPEDVTGKTVLTLDFGQLCGMICAYVEAQGESTGWISVEKALPLFIEGKDYSENVFAVVENHNQVMVMNYAIADSENDKGEPVCAAVWCNCYGDINGDGEWDDNYNVTHWMPKPLPPTPPSP